MRTNSTACSANSTRSGWASRNTIQPKANSRFSNAVTLYAVAQMHGCRIDLGDGTKATLAVVKDTGKGMFGVNSISEITRPPKLGGGTVGLSETIFATS